MKNLTFPVCLLMFALLLLPTAGRAIENPISLQYNLTFAPPHNEPVVGDRVARYRFQLIPSMEFKYFRVNTRFDLWGVNTWQPSSVVGHNWTAYENSDWAIEKYRASFTTRASVGPKVLGLFIEAYNPIDRQTWGGHGMERYNSVLVGFGGEL